jgi:hypothetical protein
LFRKLYSSARADALKELYRSKELDRERPESIEADFEEVAASCGHFSFSLLTLAEETARFLSILSDLNLGIGYFQALCGSRRRVFQMVHAYILKKKRL